MEIKLKNVRLAFPALWTPKEGVNGGNPRYGATFLIPKDDPQVAEVKKIIEAVSVEKWAAKAKTILANLNGDKKCLRDGDLKADKYAGYENCYFIPAYSKTAVGVFGNTIDPTTGKVAVLTKDSPIPYAGCMVNALIDIYAFHHPTGGDQVNANLKAVQFFKDNDAFTGGRVASADDFDASDTGAADLM